MLESLRENISIKDEVVSVIGAARSGIAAAVALQRLGARVVLSDNQSTEKLGDYRITEIAETGVEFVPGASPIQAIPERTTLVVTSPGVPKSANVLREATDRGITVWSEIELAYRLSPARIIATTGTNGKTTTTLLIASILKHAGLDAVVAGNVSADEIKKTLVEASYDALVEEAKDRVLVAEISSFQLEWIEDFAPWIGLLMNLSPDHLNRHESFEEYASTKARLFEQQTASDWALLNFDDEVVRRIGTDVINARKMWISVENGTTEVGACVLNGRLTVNANSEAPVDIMPITDIPETLPGRHNVFNVLAAATAATIAGVKPHIIAEAVRSFRGVPHRMELVGEIDGVRYINNSMCTNVAASIASLQAIGRPAIIIAGGADKEMEFGPLSDPLKLYAKHVILIGSAADKMETAFRTGGYHSISRACTLEEAVAAARALAGFGDAVVLSPGCASFDMFRDFEARGAAFRAAVRSLQREMSI